MKNTVKPLLSVSPFLAGAAAGGVLVNRITRSTPVPIDSSIDGTHAGHESSSRFTSPSETRHSDRTEQPIELLTSNVLRARIIDVFPDGYLAIIAIIQGAAFGLIFVVAQQRLSHHLDKSQVVLLAAQVLYGVTAIVIVTHLYLLLTAMLRWTPRIFDTLIPYLLGAGELLLALAIGEKSLWWLALAAFSLAGAFAFWNTRTRMNPGMFTSDKRNIYSRHRKALSVQIAYCLTMLFAGLAVGILNIYGTIPLLLDILLVCGIEAIAVTIGIFGEKSQNRIYDEYGIPRRKSAR